MAVPSNPYVTTAPLNSFLLETQGYVQGAVYDDPVARLWLAGGIYSPTATQPLWGGLPIAENTLFAGSSSDGLGGTVNIATTTAQITGYSTYNQQGHMFISAGSNAPVAAPGNTMGFFRTGTQQRIAVACSSALVTLVQGTPAEVTQQVSWNFTTQELDVYNSTTGALPIRLLSINTNSKVTSYNSTTGAVTWVSGPAALILI